MKFFRRDQEEENEGQENQDSQPRGEGDEAWYKEVRPARDRQEAEGQSPSENGEVGRRIVDLNSPPQSSGRDRQAPPKEASGRNPNPQADRSVGDRSQYEESRPSAAAPRPMRGDDRDRQRSQQYPSKEAQTMTENNSRERLPYPDLPVRNGGRPERPQSSPPPNQTASSGPRSEAAPTERTVIDRKSHFDGAYRSDSDLVVEGSFEGEIDCKGTVTVADGASVSASVRAKNVVIAGSSNGEITCDERLTIVSTGELRGKAQAATLSVEEGAFFEGEFVMGGGGKFNSSSDGFTNWESARSSKDRSTRREADTASDEKSDERDLNGAASTSADRAEAREQASADSS